jgi:nucleotide-binding universal stress UspA family protein
VYKRVLVPLDGSSLAEDILPLAERISGGFNIPLHLLSVVQQDAVAAGRAADPDASRKATQKAQDYLRGVSEQLSRRIGPERVQMSVQITQVADAIVQEADRVPETLIALSSHGRSGVQRWALGSVAGRVVSHRAVPVLVVRTA